LLLGFATKVRQHVIRAPVATVEVIADLLLSRGVDRSGDEPRQLGGVRTSSVGGHALSPALSADRLRACSP
jgi:hypothetical protein